MPKQSPFITANENIAEITWRVVLLAILLTVILAMSNAYLALKLGLLTSASIPAAMISMGILRFFKGSTILENNAVQTAASAGEAVAGGIVYTIPALIIIGYWHQFDYLTNVLIAASGGILGVLFSIPLRRMLVNEAALKFPEGRAIAEVLTTSSKKMGIQDIVFGALIGGGLEFFQVGIKVFANTWSYWLVIKQTLFGFGLGFSATMIGAGYLVGTDMAISIFLGAIIAWFIALPVASHYYPDFIHDHAIQNGATLLWNDKLRYLGIGAMLFAGIWTLLQLIRPLLRSMLLSWNAFSMENQTHLALVRTDKDLPLPLIGVGVFFMGVILFLFFQSIFPLTQAGFYGHHAVYVVLGAVSYVLIIGFLFSVITAYFSGMVGVTASPGSSVVIAGMLLAACLLLRILHTITSLPLTDVQIRAAEAITIIVGSVVTGIAAIANDNTQDLKVGQLVGATPWKQQLMLLLGVIVSALVIPPVMQVLFNVYGIAGVMPHAGMDVSESLPAPAAALLAGVTQAVFNHHLPWNMMGIGALLIVLIAVVNRFFNLQRIIQLSSLGIAMGMYLPLQSTVPLFLGGIIAFMVTRRLRHIHVDKWLHVQKGTQIACGLVAGSALMDVVLAIPFSIMYNPNALSLVGPAWEPVGVFLSILMLCLLAFWMIRRIANTFR